MADFGKRKLTKEEIEQLNLTTEILHDKYGEAWQVSEGYLTEQINQRSDDTVQHALAYSIISNGFKVLTGREREVMRLFVEDFSEYEIAKALNISRSSVKTYKKRAVKKLKKYIPKMEE